MKTAEKNANQVPTAAAKNNHLPRTENRPNIPGKEAKADEKANDQKTAPAPEAKAAEIATTPAVAVGNQSADLKSEQGVTAEAAAQEVEAPEQAQEVKAEETKGEIKYIKPALNLEQTLKHVGNLHRLTIQRLALIGRIKTLEDFEVKLVEENDQLENNPYQGCKLTIKDDKGREFTTNTPNLIRMVAQYIFDACHEKLADIEANIIFPNA